MIATCTEKIFFKDKYYSLNCTFSFYHFPYFNCRKNKEITFLKTIKENRRIFRKEEKSILEEVPIVK